MKVDTQIPQFTNFKINLINLTSITVKEMDNY